MDEWWAQEEKPLPGKGYTLDEQCKIRYGLDSDYCDPDGEDKVRGVTLKFELLEHGENKTTCALREDSAQPAVRLEKTQLSPLCA